MTVQEPITAAEKTGLIFAMPRGFNYSTTYTRDIKTRKTIPATFKTPLWVTREGRLTKGLPSLNERKFRLLEIFPYQSEIYPDSRYVAKAEEVIYFHGKWHRCRDGIRIFVMEHYIANAHIVQYPVDPARPQTVKAPATLARTP